jgi:Na+-transporting methylmalonyl-CoA/oxaloacetate decarboxylase gamma subunit
MSDKTMILLGVGIVIVCILFLFIYSNREFIKSMWNAKPEKGKNIFKSAKEASDKELRQKGYKK